MGNFESTILDGLKALPDEILVGLDYNSEREIHDSFQLNLQVMNMLTTYLLPEIHNRRGYDCQSW